MATESREWINGSLSGKGFRSLTPIGNALYVRGADLPMAPGITSIPQSLLALSDELEALGGGDARVGRARVSVRVRPASQGAISIVEADGTSGTVRVRDPRCPGASSCCQAALYAIGWSHVATMALRREEQRTRSLSRAGTT